MSADPNLKASSWPHYRYYVGVGYMGLYRGYKGLYRDYMGVIWGLYRGYLAGYIGITWGLYGGYMGVV